MGEWIKVEDRLPDPDERVIGFDSFYFRVGEAEMSDWARRLVFIDADDCNITHWQPMPQMPQERVDDA